MKAEELIDITDKVDDVLHGYGIIVDHGILAHHILKVIKESHPNDNIMLESPDLKPLLGLKTLPEIV